MQGEPVFVRYRRNLSEMSDKKLVTVGKHVSVKIFAKPYKVCLVHADINEPWRKGFAKRFKHFIDKRVSLFVFDKQNIVYIDYILIMRQFREIVEMREGLDSGDKLHAFSLSVSVDIFKLPSGVSTP